MKNLVGILLLFSLVVGCSKPAAPPAPPKDDHGHTEEAGHEDHIDLSPEAQKTAGIEIVTVRRESIQPVFDVPGTVTSANKGRAVVTPPVSGRVTSISVQLGDTVQQGQTVAMIESPELALAWSSIADAKRQRDAAASALVEAKSELMLSNAKLMASKANLVRQMEFAKAGAFSQAALQEAKNNLNEAQSELLSAQQEQAIHAAQVQRLENLYREGLVSRAEVEAARLELQHDQIRLDRAKARIENEKITVERETKIAGRGLLDAKEIQAAEAEVRSLEIERDRAQIRIRSAESSLASADQGLSNAKAVYQSTSGRGGGSVGSVALVAPIAGTVTAVDVTQGQAVDRTQSLFEIENLQSVWVTAHVPEQEASRIQKGSMVVVTVSGVEGEFQGTVLVTGSRVDPKTRSLPVQCLITDARGLLKPNMFANVRISVGARVSGLIVPESAIVTEGKETFVFIKEVDEFERRKVSLGTRSGGVVEVLAGLDIGDSVVSKGTFVLVSEQKKGELKGHDH